MNELYLMEAGELLLKQNYDSAFRLLDTDRQERVTRMRQDKNKALCMAAGLLPAYVLEEYKRTENVCGAAEDIPDAGQAEHTNRVNINTNDVSKPRLILPVTYINASQILASSDKEPAVIAKKANGKPYFKDFPDVFFNLSHSGDYAVCAVSDKEIGVDIQEYRSITGKLADRILHERECSLYRKLQPEQLLQIWAAKEAFVKCTGDGLSKDFRELCVDFTAGEVTDTVNGKRLQLMLSEAVEGYVLAVCRA